LQGHPKAVVQAVVFGKL